MKKLNLGCDSDYKEGWVNLDFHKSLKCDVLHDLNEFPYPFEDNQFDYIYMNHVLEHVRDVHRCINELYRISKNNAIIEINVPYFNSFNAFRDVTHYSFFTWDSLSPFCGFVSKEGKYEVGYLDKLFKYKERKLTFAVSQKFGIRHFCKLMTFLVNLNPYFMEKYFPWIIPSEELRIKLEVVKK